MPDRAAPQVLYVEDDRMHLVLMEEVFRRLPGWELICAETGAEALALLADECPTLALIDMNLPDTDGLALIARIQQMPQHAGMRCVVLSADDPAHSLAAAQAAGFDDYWLKPIDVLKLQAVLLKMLEA